MTSNKYGAKKTQYNGRTYDSGLEAQMAQILHEESPHALFVDEQVPFTLIPKSRFGRAIVYKADFVVLWKNKKRTILEIKGLETPVFKLKLRLFKERYPNETVVIIKTKEELLEIVTENI